jgi:hypothetical protein
MCNNLLYFYSSQTVCSHWGTLMRAGTARKDYPDIQLNKRWQHASESPFCG